MICLGCDADTQWVGGLGIFWPTDGGRPQPYALCETCSQRMASGDCEEITKRVDLHFAATEGNA